MKYGQILQEIDDVLIKRAFIPSPNSSSLQGGGQPPQGDSGQSGGGGQDPAAAMAQLAQQHAQLTGAGQGGQQPQDPSQGQAPQDPSQQGQPGQQDPNSPPGGDLSPKGMAQSLKNTNVTVTVADLLDLVSGGKASQAHLKTESMKVQHGFKHKKMLRDEQRKEQDEQMKQQQEQAMQQQQQQGMMGGGIYGGGPMDGQNAPGQPGQPPPASGGGMAPQQPMGQ